MNNALETRYFLSAMTGAGYYALHRQFLRPPERYFCILKGRAGAAASPPSCAASATWGAPPGSRSSGCTARATRPRSTACNFPAKARRLL